MCECLNNVVEIAVCVQAGALADRDAPAELQAVAAWAGHEHTIDVAMARSAPVHYAVALINVPRSGPTADWLIAELARIITVEEACGLHPAWQAHGGVWLAQMASIVALRSSDTEAAERALTTARAAVEAVGGVCTDSLGAPASGAELELYPSSWLECEGPRVSVPTAAELHTAAISRSVPPSAIDGVESLVLGLRTMSTDDWRTWPSAALVQRIHAG
jgi:hypothetical protein